MMRALDSFSLTAARLVSDLGLLPNIIAGSSPRQDIYAVLSRATHDIPGGPK